jgi:hypothetical protein
MLDRILVALALLILATAAHAGPVGSRFQVNTAMALDQEEPAVAPLNDGGFVVVWRSDYVNAEGIHGQAYDALGRKKRTEFQVSSLRQGVQQSPSVAALKDGAFVVTWSAYGQDGSGYGVYGQRYRADGQRAGVEFRVNTTTSGDQQYPSVVGLENGGFVVVWYSLQTGAVETIHGQRYNAAGARVGVEFKVNKQQVHTERAPRVGALADGGFVVTWFSQNDSTHQGIFGQRYNVNGARVGMEFKVDSSVARGVAQDPFVVGLAKGGGFVVAWYFDHSTTSVAGIYAQRYRSDGSRVGNAFRVNTFFRTLRPAIAALNDGGFVVCWRATSGTGAGLARCQRHSDLAQRIGSEFGVGAAKPNQGAPSVAGLGGGGFVVTWADDDQDYDGIFGQRFNP